MGKNYIIIGILIIYCVTLFSCDERPERKQLPDFNSSQSFGCGFPFYGYMKNERESIHFSVSDTSIFFKGRKEFLFCIRITTPVEDTFAFDLVKRYEILANPLFDHILNKGKAGVVIDIRSGIDAKSYRIDYVGERNGAMQKNSSIAVILIWDEFSASRAIEYSQALQSISAILIEGSASDNNTSRQDCFKKSKDDL